MVLARLKQQKKRRLRTALAVSEKLPPLRGWKRKNPINSNQNYIKTDQDYIKVDHGNKLGTSKPINFLLLRGPYF